MTQEFKNMLYLFGCGATGHQPVAEHCVNIRKIRDISIAQNVWPIVYSAIRKKLSDGEVKIPDDIYSQLELAFQTNVGKTIQKNEFNKNVIKNLKQNGVECCLLKGMALASLYNIPETRVSSDVDILIPPEDEDKAEVVLKDLGYNVNKRLEFEHHSEAFHPIGGTMEVHISMMRKNWDDIIFSNKIEYCEEYISIEDGIYTLGINDTLINTVTHFIKHFVRSGAGVRHIMDMLLYMKKYESQINWEKFNSLMNELQYGKLIDTAKSVGVKYWGFEFENFTCVDAELIDLFLTDIEKGGVFGGNDAARGETYAQFTQKRKKMSALQYKKYSVSNMERTLIQKIFPEKEYMMKFYGMKNGGICSLAAAHIRRIKSVFGNILSGKIGFEQYMYGESKEITEQVNERIDLFRKMNIID